MVENANFAKVLFESRAAAARTALICGEASWTYGQLAELAGRAGNAFQALGLEREQRIALLLWDGPEFVASFYGAGAAGILPIPLNTSLTAADHAYILNHCRAKAVVVSAALAHLVAPIRAQCPFLRHVIVVGGEAAPGVLDWQTLIDTASPLTAPVAALADEPAFFLYSSGSTGRPKGIVHQHRAIPATCRDYSSGILNLTSGDVCFSAAKLFHAYGLGNGMNFPLAAGATTVLWPGPPLAESLFEVIARHRATIFFATPALFVQMLAVPEAAQKYDLSSLRLCVSAAESLPAVTFERWRDRFGVEILDGIGSSEMLHIFLSNRPGEAAGGSSGRVVPGYDAKIVDEAGQLLPEGETGDLWVRGESSSMSYWNDRAKTQATMRGEWMVTGDKYRCDEQGRYWHQGRSDDMLKVNGTWVSPVELEGILQEHPDVAECAVIGLRDADDLMQVKAYIILRAGVVESPVLARQLQTFVRQRAPQRYPRSFEFVTTLPKTATGKIKRFALRESAAAAIAS